MSLSRTSAAAAALALVAASVFAGSLSASAYAPTSITLDVISPATSVSTDLIGVSGTVDYRSQEQRVEVYREAGGIEVLYCAIEIAGGAATNPALPWSCGDPFYEYTNYSATSNPVGEYTFSAVSFELATPGEVSARSNAVPYTVGDTTAPTMTMPTDGSATDDAAPPFAGTGPALGTVDVTANGGVVCDDVAVDENGDWYCTPTALVSDSYALTVSSTDVVGNTQESDPPVALTIEIPQAPDLFLTADPWVTANPLVTMSGETNGNQATITIWRELAGGGTALYCEQAISTSPGPWTCDPSADALTDQLAPGDNTLRAAARSKAGELGNYSSPIVVTLIEAPQITSPLATDPDQPVYTNDSTPTWSGTADPSSSWVDVVSSGLFFAVSYCDGEATGGLWTCTRSTPLADGTYQVIPTVSGADAAGTERTIIIDTIAPAAATVITSGSMVGPRPTITGTAEPSSTVTTFLDGEAIECTDPVVADASTGAWSCTPSADVAYGQHTVSARAVDRAGNPSSEGVPPTMTMIAVEPPPVLPKPTMHYELGPASISIAGEAVSGADIRMNFYAVSLSSGESGPGYGYAYLDDCGTDPGEGEGEGGGESEGGTPAGGLSPAVGTVGCTFSDLAPGIYNVYTNQVLESTTSEYQNDYVLIPSTPTLVGSVDDDGYATYRGTGTIGYFVIVRDAAESTLCSATVSEEGTWSCGTDLVNGTTIARATQRSVGFVASTGNEFDVPDLSLQGFSAYTAGAILSYTPAPNSEPTPEPTPSATPAPVPTPTPTTTPTLSTPLPWVFTFTAGRSNFAPGDSTTLTGAGLPPGAAVSAEFHSTPVFLGSSTVTPAGEFSLPVTIPDDAEPGVHTFVVTVTPLDGLPSTTTQEVTVVAPPRAQAESTTRDTPAAAGTTLGTDRSDPASPSSLTTSLMTLQDVLTHPAVIGGAALASIALFLLVAFPAELLNSTIAGNYDRLTRRIPRVRAPWWERLSTWMEKTPFLGGLAMTVIAATIFGFADPGFGFDITSVRVVLACALALLVVGYLASSIAGVIIRRRWGLATEMELKPLGLILTVIGVVLSRLLDFSPGFLLGLIVGISVVGTTTVAQRAKATLVQAGVVFVLAVLGWVGYSILTAVTEPNSFLTVLALDTMVAITAEGLTALFIGLLPFRLLTGAEIFAHSRVLWALTYTVAAMAFVLIVVPSSWGELTGSLTTWLIVLGGFAAVAVATYLFFRFTGGGGDGAEGVDEQEPEQEPVQSGT